MDDMGAAWKRLMEELRDLLEAGMFSELAAKAVEQLQEAWHDGRVTIVPRKE